MKSIPNIGDRLVVHGMLGFIATVESVTWDPKSIDWLIIIDWGKYGKSRVWARDEGSIWHRWLELN